jgi:hypothetical protein
MPLRHRAWPEAAAVFALALVLFRWQIGRWDGSPDFDGHYHLRVVYWIAHHGLWTDIPWLPFTVLGERGPDHHWLWHLALLPFAWLDDPVQALRWAAAFNGAATVATIALVMRLLGVPAAPLFALLAVSASLLMPYRLLMLRTQNAAVIFMMLALWAMARDRTKSLAVIAFLFLESYHAAVVLAPMAFIGAAARSAVERRLVTAPLVAVAAGLTAALAVSPWFPRNIEYLLFHLFFKAPHSILGEQISSLISTEWYPPGWARLATESWPAHAMLAAAVAALGWRRLRDPSFRPPADTLMAMGVALLSLALYWQAARFAEYYVPFAVLAAGLAARDALAGRRYAALLLTWTLIVVAMSAVNLQKVRLMPADHLARVGQRLNELGKPGDVVFNSSWTDFMALVWWADGFRYVNGLDGHYLAYRDPARFAVWLAAGAGAIDEPAKPIAQAFSARFVVVARQHERLAEQLMRSPDAVLRLAARDGWLFEIRR